MVACGFLLSSPLSIAQELKVAKKLSNTPVLNDYSGHENVKKELERQRDKLKLQKEVKLLEVDLKALETGGKKEEKGSKIDSAILIGTQSESPYETGMDKISANQKLSVLEDMSLMSTFGSGDTLQADIYLHGGRMTVSLGQELPGGWIVQEIKSHRILVSSASNEGNLIEILMRSPGMAEQKSIARYGVNSDGVYGSGSSSGSGSQSVINPNLR